MLCIPGEHVSHQDLAYQPWVYSAITSYNHSQVIVAEDLSSSLHIHQLPSGEEIRTISYTQLGLEENDHVHVVHYADSRLHLAVGLFYTKALHVYEVCAHFTVMIIQTNISTSFLYSYKIHIQHSIQH